MLDRELEKLCLQVISCIEGLEQNQFNLGIINTAITSKLIAETLEVAEEELQKALATLIKAGAIIELETNTYRSRVAETTRLIRLVRQRFNGRSLPQSMELVEAVRVEFRRRKRPDRKVEPENLTKTLQEPIDEDIKQSLMWMIKEGLDWPTLSGFQQRSFETIYDLSRKRELTDEAVIVAGDTGSGKTEAFLFPLLAAIAQRKRDLDARDTHSGVGAVLVYPRIRLAMNQLERITKILKLWEMYGGPKLKIGVQNAQVKGNATQYIEKDRRNHTEPRSIVMPLIASPFKPSKEELDSLTNNGQREADSSLVFKDEAAFNQANKGYPELVSRNPDYWKEQSYAEKTEHQKFLNDGVLNNILVTKEALLTGTRKNPDDIPDILIITDKSLSQYLLKPEAQHLWGLWWTPSGKAIAPPAFLVMDEIHLSNGLDGAHLSRIISRFQSRIKVVATQLSIEPAYAIPIGVSATLYNEKGFMGKILGFSPDESEDKVHLCKPLDSELEDTKGRERYIFVRPHEIPDPTSPEKRVGGMDAAIQIVMASMHNLMDRKKGATYRYKGLAFFDSINAVNLFEQYYNKPHTPNGREGANPGRLWKIRTQPQCRIMKKPCNHSYASCPLFLAGDCWLFAQKYGWDDALTVSSANYAGMEVDLQKAHLIPTSPSLEVGYDDETIQFVYQHMAPNNVAAFIQRRGRAGRNPDHSPVIVTLLWPYRAKDLFYFYQPNYLYDPCFDDIPLNPRNRHVQITHAFLAIFDWLALRTATDRWQEIEDNATREVLSKNYTYLTNNLRRRLTTGQLRDWGLLMVNQLREELEEYLNTQVPVLAPGVIDEVLNYLRDRFFSPAEHRTVISPPKGRSSTYHNNGNFLGTFKLVDFDLRGDGGESIVEVTYPQGQDQTSEEGEDVKSESKPIERGAIELLPGNATFRLRIDQAAYWTPIGLDKASTYLYPNDAAKDEAVRGNKTLKIDKDSLMGIPSFLNKLYPGLLYFTPRNLSVQRFRQKDNDPEWVYDQERQISISIHSGKLQNNRNVRKIELQAQAFASSIIIPYRIDKQSDTNVAIPIRIPRYLNLNQIFAQITAYLNKPIGYLQVLYQYDIAVRLRKEGKDKKNNTHNKDYEYPKIRRSFYGPNSTPENPDPRLVAFKVETQGIEFKLSNHFNKAIVQKIEEDPKLRFYLRQRYVVYHVGKSYAYLETKQLPMHYMEIARLFLAFWLGKIAPERINTQSQDNWSTWELSTNDFAAIKDFAHGGPLDVNGHWGTEKTVSALLSDFLEDPTNLESFVKHINNAIKEGFTDSTGFYEFLESVALHSLASVIKNHCALLGGVSSDALVVYADLSSGLENVSRSQVPRIIVFDTVAGGSGAIGQVFENLTRQPRNRRETAIHSKDAEDSDNDRNLWSLLQKRIGVCPVGDGEDILRRFLLSMTYEEAEQFIINIRSNHASQSERLKSEIEKRGFPPPDQATFETIARIIFTGEVYVASGALVDDDLLDTDSIPQTATSEQDNNNEFVTIQDPIHPPLIVHELIRQEDELQRMLNYRPQPEMVVAKLLNTIDSWTHTKRLQKAMEQDLETSHFTEDKSTRLHRQMTSQLLSLLPRRCEDGCPVCMVSGSDMESPPFTNYLNSRSILKKIRDILLVDSARPATDPTNDLIAGRSVRFSNNSSLSNLPHFAGLLKAITLDDSGKHATTTFTPVPYINPKGEIKSFSLVEGKVIDSPGEAKIAGYLELRRKYNNWIVRHKNPGEPFKFKGELTEVVLDFFVRVPYYEQGEEDYLDLYIEYWSENEKDAEERNKKERYFKAGNNKLSIDIEKEDLSGNMFIQIIEKKVQEIMQERGIAFELPSLELLPEPMVEPASSSLEEDFNTPQDGRRTYQQEEDNGADKDDIFLESCNEQLATALEGEQGHEYSQSDQHHQSDTQRYLTLDITQSFLLCNRQGILREARDPTLQSVEDCIHTIICNRAEKALAVGMPLSAIFTTRPSYRDFEREDWLSIHTLPLLSYRRHGNPWTIDTAIECVQSCLRSLGEWAIQLLLRKVEWQVIDVNRRSMVDVTETLKLEAQADLILKHGTDVAVIRWNVSQKNALEGKDIPAKYAAFAQLTSHEDINRVYYVDIYLDRQHELKYQMFTRSQLEDLRSSILSIANEITKKREENKPKVGEHCHQCIFSQDVELCAYGHQMYPPFETDILRPERPNQR